MTDANLVQRERPLVPIHLAADTHSIEAFRIHAHVSRQAERSVGWGERQDSWP
jgi:3-dehydroquinate dehydratase